MFSDDPPDLVEKVRRGTINWARCNHPNCGFEGGWLWPAAFLYVDVEERRGVCVTMATAAAQQIDLLRDALDSDSIRRRGLDPESLLRRTRFVNDYRAVEAALEYDLEVLELENTALLQYLERQHLSGRARVEALIEAVVKSGAASFESTEITAEFLSELEDYQSTLTGEEDGRVPQVLEQIIDLLRAKVAARAKTLPSRDDDSVLAEVLRAARASADHVMAKASFERRLAKAEAEALQLRLARLCELQSGGRLNRSVVAPIDSRHDMLQLVDGLIASQEPSNALLRPIDRSVLPAVRSYLESPTSLPEAGSRSDLQPDVDRPPVPSWVPRADKIFREMLVASASGGVSDSLLESASGEPLVQAYVNGEIAKTLLQQNQLSGAMSHLTGALDIFASEIEGRGSSSDYWVARLNAVCLERMGDLQLRFGRLEESIEELRAARIIYEQIGARDGLQYCLGMEASIWLDLGHLQRAEELFARLVRETEGLGTADECRQLANLSNVYRRLRPYADLEMRFMAEAQNAESKGDSEAPSASPEGVAIPTPENPFKAKAGIRVSGRADGHDELSYHDMVGSEPIRLLFRGLAVARLNDDDASGQMILGRLAVVFGEFGCRALADLVLDKLLESSALEDTGPDALMLVFNRLGIRANEQQAADEAESALATRHEMLLVLDFVLEHGAGVSGLSKGELRGEKATLLEAVGRLEEARQEYLATIESLEHSRAWLRDPENKKGLQSRRWRPYVRGARNALRMHAMDRTRDDLLIEAWQLTQAGRSRALLDAIGAERDVKTSDDGIVSVRPGSFSTVANSLPRDVAILEYFLMPTTPGCAGSWAMMVVEPGATAPWLAWQEPDMERVLEAKQRLAGLADEYDKTIVQYGIVSSPGDLEQQYLAALEELADIILPPGLADQLSERGYRKLVIVADSYLHEVPFAALRPLRDGRRVYFGLAGSGQGFQVAYAPSSSIYVHWLGIVPARVSAARRTAFFIDPLGDLAERNSDVMPTFGAIEDDLRERSIAVSIFDRDRATASAWVDEVGAHDLVVYFGHSVAGQGDPERAALMLSDGAGAAAPVSAAQIYRESSREPFSCRSLIIFASCSGGRAFPGDWDSDRELTGLSIAHLHAGCATVIAASRPLLDSPTLILLRAVLARLVAGDDASTSLSETQREMAESPNAYRHPHFWGYLGLMGVPQWRLADRGE